MVESDLVRAEANFRRASGHLGSHADGAGVTSIGLQDPRAVAFLTGAFHKLGADRETRYQNPPAGLAMSVAQAASYLGMPAAQAAALAAFEERLQEGTPAEALDRFITAQATPGAEDFSVRAAVHCLTHFDETFGYVAGDAAEADGFAFDFDFDFSQLNADALANLLLVASGLPVYLVSPTKLWGFCEQWAQAGMDADQFAARMGHVLSVFPFVHAPTRVPDVTTFASLVAAHLEADQIEALDAYLALPVAARQTAAVWEGVAPAQVSECQARAVKEVLATLMPTVPEGLVYIPPGEFLMGSPEDEVGRDPDREIQHLVRLSHGFFVAKHPVTQGAYAAMMDDNPSHFSTVARAPECPVEMVTWEEAIAYCNAKSEAEGLEPCYVGEEFHPESGGYRLLTEAEWEYAARAGTTGPLYGELDAIAWHSGNSEGHTHPVGELAPNAFGLHDMFGNVYEWVGDWFAGDLSGGEPTDPTGPGAGQFRVYRGGSHGSSRRFVRAAYRYGRLPSDRGLNLGFRLARSVPLAP